MANIIIITFNLPEKEKECIDSVKKYTGEHTLTVYDNYPKKENLAVVWNRLIENSKHDKICLLNNDTVVEKGWDKMLEVLDDPKVGAVGPVTNNCGGKQKGMEKNGKVEEIKDLSGFCYCFRKEVWEEVGRFPEDMPFYGQETVFNRKLQDHGYKLMVDRRVYVHHYKGRSWHKARKAGEINDNNREYGRMHYYNFVNRLEKVKKLPRNVVVLGAPTSPFPTFHGINQTCSDFGYIHLPMDATFKEIMSHKPEILIVAQSRYNPDWYEVIRKVKAEGVKTGLYFMDLRTPKSEGRFKTTFDMDLSPYFDKAFFNAKGVMKDWEMFNIKTEWMPQGTIQQPIPPIGENLGTVHIGDINNASFHSNRQEFLKEIDYVNLDSKVRDKRAEIVSRQWGIYGSSDFSLAISPDVEGYTSDRVYHIMGSGGELVSFDPGGLEHLKPYGHWFKTKEELREILKKPRDEKLRKRAFDYTQTNHLYKDRIISIIESLCEQ